MSTALGFYNVNGQVPKDGAFNSIWAQYYTGIIPPGTVDSAPGMGVGIFSPSPLGTFLVNVKDYGAVGDAVTNDYSAIASAAAQNPGLTLYFPPGTYVINTGASTWSVTNSLYSIPTQGSAILKPNVSLTIASSNLSFYGITIYASPVIATSVSNTVFKNCIFSQATTIFTATSCTNTLILNSFWTASARIVMVSCTMMLFMGNQEVSTGATQWITLTGTSTQIQIIDNSSSNSTSAKFIVDSANVVGTNIVIAQNLVQVQVLTLTTGIYVDLIIHKNKFLQMTITPATSVTNGFITSNVMGSAGGNIPITLSNGVRCVVMSNYISGGGTPPQAILATTVTNSVISDNIIDQCTIAIELAGVSTGIVITGNCLNGGAGIPIKGAVGCTGVNVGGNYIAAAFATGGLTALAGNKQLPSASITTCSSATAATNYGGSYITMLGVGNTETYYIPCKTVAW